MSKKEIKDNGLNVAEIRFQHYRFELELHPDDDPEQLHKDVNDFHLDQQG